MLPLLASSYIILYEDQEDSYFIYTYILLL